MLQSAHRRQQVFVAAEILENSTMNKWKHVKGIENPADTGTRGMCIEGLKEPEWLNEPAWLQTDEEKWPKPWCQMNEVEAEQVTSTLATETDFDRLIEWSHDSTELETSLHCLLHEVQNGAERTPQSRRNPSSRTNTVSICSNRKLPECFKIDSEE